MREQLCQQAKQCQPMFVKMLQVRHLKAKAQGNAAVVEISGRALRFARVHHLGESDAVTPGGPQYQDPTRELIGITEKDYDAIRDAVLQHTGQSLKPQKGFNLE